MASVQSNRPEVVALLGRLRGLLDLSRPGPGGRRRLGDEAADVIAAGVVRRTREEQVGADGSPLPRLARSTLIRKARLGYPATIGVETGEMLEFEQVRGMVATSPNEMRMEYGLDAEMKDRADWFSTGDPSNGRAPRPFYELDPAIEGELEDLFERAFERGLRDLGATEG